MEDEIAPETAPTRKKKSDDVVGTVERVIRLLQFVAEEKEFNLKTATSALGLPPSTVHRMLQFLVREDLVGRRSQQIYCIGTEFYRLGSLAVEKFDFNSVAHPHLVSIAERYKETSSFALYLAGRRAGVIVDTIPTQYPLQYRVEPFALWSLAWGALGRAMLAYLGDDEVAAVLAEAPVSPATGQEVPTKESIAAELAGIRTLGYYVSINQNVLGATGTAAPVLGPGGRLIGSIGLTIPVARYDASMQPEINETLRDHARALSSALGFDGRS